jgi:hypothetical protein
VYFLGIKGGRFVRLTTLPPSCAVVMKSGSLKFLKPSGPLQACNGTALPFTFAYAQNWGEPDVDGRIILRGIFRKWEGVVGTGWIGLRIGTVGGHL